MARAKQSGAGIYVALVLMSIGFVVCLILSIVFHMRNAAEHEAAVQAVESQRRFVTQAEERAADVVAMLADPSRGTVVQQLRDENMQLKRWILDAADADVARVRSEVQARLGSDTGVSLLREVDRLRAEYNGHTNRIRELQAALTDAEQRAAEAERGNRNLTAEYDRSRAQLQADLTGLRTSQEQFSSQVTQQQTTLRQQLDTLRTTLNRQLTDLRNELAQVSQERDELRDRLRVIMVDARETGAIGRVDPSITPDGHIVAVIADDNLVYIDRGRHHRVMLGLTFQVFDRVPGIVTNAQGEYEGKAKIEVVQVSENSAVARIVERGRNVTLSAGDIIANAVYDPNMSFKFYVFGEFDIDNVGQATVSDRRRIETMIHQWGGQVVQRQPGASVALSYDVDFLVLGTEPDVPRPPDADETDPVVLESYRAAMVRYETYEELRRQAGIMSIPILNQNRFLTLVGYYQR